MPFFNMFRFTQRHAAPALIAGVLRVSDEEMDGHGTWDWLKELQVHSHLLSRRIALPSIWVIHKQLLVMWTSDLIAC